MEFRKLLAINAIFNPISKIPRSELFPVIRINKYLLMGKTKLLIAPKLRNLYDNNNMCFNSFLFILPIFTGVYFLIINIK